MTGRSVGRVLALLAVWLVALVGGSVAAFVHRVTVEVLGVQVPVGMIAGIGALAGLGLLARLIVRRRAAVLAVTAAYVVPILVLSQSRPEGDLVIAEDAWGVGLLIGLAAVATAAVVVPFTTYHGTGTGQVSDPAPASEVATEAL